MATIRRARVVVTHAGVGSVMVSLANGKRPVVVPRLKSFGEAVDDHQLQLGRRFAAAGLVTLVEAPDGLGAALAPSSNRRRSSRARARSPPTSRSFLEDAIPRPRRRTRMTRTSSARRTGSARAS